MFGTILDIFMSVIIIIVAYELGYRFFDFIFNMVR